MNSMEEKAFFEEWGWEKNYATGEWVAPDGVNRISTQDLVDYVTGGPMAQAHMEAIVRALGKKA